MLHSTLLLLLVVCAGSLLAEDTQENTDMERDKRSSSFVRFGKSLEFDEPALPGQQEQRVLSLPLRRAMKDNFIRFGRNSYMDEHAFPGKRAKSSFIRFGRNPDVQDKDLSTSNFYSKFHYEPTIDGNKIDKRSLMDSSEDKSSEEYSDEAVGYDGEEQDKRGKSSFLRFGRRELSYPAYLYKSKVRRGGFYSPSTASKRLLQKSFLRFGRAGDKSRRQDSFIRFG